MKEKKEKLFNSLKIVIKTKSYIESEWNQRRELETKRGKRK